MTSSRTGKDPVSTPDTSLPVSTVSPSSRHLLPLRLLHHPARHVRGILRLARQRRTFALALLAGSATTVGTVSAATVAAIQFQRSIAAPLAGPRPVPSPLGSSLEALGANKPATPKHHFLAAALHSHPLRGLASWYGSVWQGRKTASGEVFREAELTAAHRTLPFGTLVRVTDLRSLRSVIVRINDRGALAPGRVIDLSAAAADQLGILDSGLASVKLEVLERPEKA